MRFNYVQAKSPGEALEKCPWAVAIDKVSDGYFICFESMDDYLAYTR